MPDAVFRIDGVLAGSVFSRLAQKHCLRTSHFNGPVTGCVMSTPGTKVNCHEQPEHTNGKAERRGRRCRIAVLDHSFDATIAAVVLAIRKQFKASGSDTSGMRLRWYPESWPI